MQKESWRKTIIDAILDEGELDMDTLHEGADGGDELQEAIDAADQLVKDGLLSWDCSVYAQAPGMRDALKEAQAAYNR